MTQQTFTAKQRVQWNEDGRTVTGTFLWKETGVWDMCVLRPDPQFRVAVCRGTTAAQNGYVSRLQDVHQVTAI